MVQSIGRDHRHVGPPKRPESIRITDGYADLVPVRFSLRIGVIVSLARTWESDVKCVFNEAESGEHGAGPVLDLA